MRSLLPGMVWLLPSTLKVLMTNSVVLSLVDGGVVGGGVVGVVGVVGMLGRGIEANRRSIACLACSKSFCNSVASEDCTE
ncbi:hypothetical protein D3C72_2443110 [compost metagenome]